MRPYRYFTYGLQIHSDIALPLWPAPAELSADTPDIDIERLPAKPLSRKASPLGHEFRISPKTGELVANVIGRFVVQSGRPVRVAAEPLPETPDDFLAHFLSGTIMAMAIHYYGLMPLHGCAVKINGATAVFLGVAGMGKSSLCAALCRLGHQIITDDISPVCWIDERPHVMPGYPRMKLNKDVVEALEPPADELTVLHGAHPKVGWLRAECRFDQPEPIQHLFLLGIGEREIRPVSGIQAFSRIQACSAPSQWGFDGGGEHFLACSRVVNALSIHAFMREREIGLLQEQAEFISRFVEGLERGEVPDRSTDRGIMVVR